MNGVKQKIKSNGLPQSSRLFVAKHVLDSYGFRPRYELCYRRQETAPLYTLGRGGLRRRYTYILPLYISAPNMSSVFLFMLKTNANSILI